MADTVTYIYDEKSQGPRDGIDVFKVVGGVETQIYNGEWADSSIGYDALKSEAINALQANYPDIASMTLRPKPPAPPPVAAPPPPAIPPKPYVPPPPVEGPKRYIPKGRYKKPESTVGGEFTELESGEPYKGFYIETYKGKYYAGKTPEEGGVELVKEKKIADQLALLGIVGATVPGLLAGFFKKKPTQFEKQKGVTKRNFIQDKNNNKITETDPDTYAQAKEVLVNSTFVEVDWIIQGPAEDKMFGKYPFEGAESKNRKTIQALEKTMPGISTFVTDYRYLVEEPVINQQPLLTFTEVERDPNEAQEDFRKARFDRRSDLIFPSASIFDNSAETTPTPTPPPPLVFVSTWNTSPNPTLAGSSTSTQVKLPLESTGTYDFTVDWGDGSALENITTAAAGIHTYGTAGTYTISITGTLIGFSFGSTVNPTNTNERLKILSISSWGPIRLGNSGGYFNSCTNLTLDTITDILNLTGTTTLATMFFGCTSITTVGRMNEWDLSGVTNLSGMFGIAVGGGTTGAGLFNQDIGAWNVSNVTNFSEMFRFTRFFNNGGSPNIGNWNMSSAINLGGMFSRANSFNQPIANWERSTPGNTSTLANVQFMNDMFSSSNNLLGFNQPIGNWNVSGVTNMNNLFYRSPFNQDIGNWNVSNVTLFGTLFGSAAAFSPANLDLIYNGWSSRTVRPGTPGQTTILFTSKFTNASLAGRNILTSSPNNWTIVDGTAISGVANNGGLIRITTSQNHGWVTGNVVYVFNVGGTTAANGTWTITVISANVIDLQGSSHNAAWTSGGNTILA